MSRRDEITRKYMREPAHFADFFNGYIYNGEEKIKPECLSEVDTTNIASIPSDDGKKDILVKRYRDILKKSILIL